MSKVPAKKQQAIERIAAHLLAEGLNQTGLRLLAKVADTSDRMLIYYFGSKEALLDEVMGAIAATVTVQLDALLGSEQRPADVLLAQATNIMMHDGFTPAVQLWFELVGLAARGHEPYLANAKLISNNWIEWITSRLAEADKDKAADLYAHLEGRLMLKLIQAQAATEA